MFSKGDNFTFPIANNELNLVDLIEGTIGEICFKVTNINFFLV